MPTRAAHLLHPVSTAISSPSRRRAVTSLAIAAALITLPATALPEPIVLGTDLSWNDCVIGAPAFSKNLVCTGTQNQNYTLLVNFKSQVSVPRCFAIQAVIELASATPGPLAPFWHFESGGCQGGATKGVTLSAVIPLSCADVGMAEIWDGGAAISSSVMAYAPDDPTPGHGLFTLTCIRTGSRPIDAGVNYYAFHLTFNNRNRVNCAGCTQQAALKILDLRLVSDDGSPDVHLRGPDKYTDCVFINNAPPGLCSTITLDVPRDASSFTRLLMHPPRPNPTGGAVVIPFELPALQTVVAQVIDVRGRVVRNLASGQVFSPGLRSLSWDGRDDEGSALPGGIYLVSVRAGGHLGVRKVALLP